ncbi:AfsR/SARP family transcriptional regulator [Streptomyces sp. NPDC050625]|uniref:AfsR/SARP family transcriptional regulator n=1 Tax=Streptomyces sp. NPDC050625 TaxID=3154629 RepID=UPI00341BE796
MNKPVVGRHDQAASAVTGTQERPAPRHLFFRVLGPCEVESASGPVDLGPPQRRALLLCLLLEDERPMSVGRLVELLWGDRPPASAAASIHAHVCRLRAALTGPGVSGEPTVLLSTGRGYALRVPPQHRDTALFEQFLEQAHCLTQLGRPTAARTAVDRALALWRGEPFAELRGHPVAQQVTCCLDELRRTALDLRAGLLLAEGRPVQAMLAAEGLVADSPFRETSWVTLLKALCAAGRPTEALVRYETVRHLFAEALGTSPGPELQQVHMQLLRQTGNEVPMTAARFRSDGVR